MSKGGGTVVGVGAVAFVGTIISDGKGNATNPFTVSLNGDVSRHVDSPTYTLNGDCTGTFTSADGTQHFDFRISPDGKKFDYIETDPETVVSGSASRVDRGD
jgi:hypothetical protein